MTTNNPSVWSPAPSAADGVPNLSYLSGVQIPVPEDGIAVFVTDTGGGPTSGANYRLSLLSGAVIAPPLVVGTFLGGATRWLQDAGGGGITGIVVEDESVPLPGDYQTFNFTGAGVVASDAGGGVTDITIPGGPAAGDNIVRAGITTAGIAVGDVVYISAANVASKTDADAAASSAMFGVSEGLAGSITTDGNVTAKFTTAGGSPANGAPVYLAPGTEEAGATGKLTATAPVVAGKFVAEAGTVISNANWAGLKTCTVHISEKSVIAL